MICKSMDSTGGWKPAEFRTAPILAKVPGDAWGCMGMHEDAWGCMGMHGDAWGCRELSCLETGGVDVAMCEEG